MVSFSAPIRRGGRLVGVVTADLAIDYFRKMRVSLDNLELGADFYCFLFSPGGHILSHSLDRYEFPNPQSDLNKLLVQADLRRVVERMHKETNGLARAIDPLSGKEATFLFARVPSAGWTFVIVKQ